VTGATPAAGVTSVAAVEVMTADGPARVELEVPAAPSFLLALTHGAGGLPDTPDLLAVREAALPFGGAVARITQPYRVRGARSPGAAGRQDAAWTDVISWLRAEFRGTGPGIRAAADQAAGSGTAGAQPAGGPRPGRGEIPLIQGGRSNGARLVCRTACATRASAVIALAFPLHPPGRSRQGRSAAPAQRSRAAELRSARGAGAGVLVINGDRDPFGIPGHDDAARVIVLPGESHSLSKNPAAVSEAVTAWLRDILPLARWHLRVR